jgi:hypothetical protein
MLGAHPTEPAGSSLQCQRQRSAILAVGFGDSDGLMLMAI